MSEALHKGLYKKLRDQRAGIMGGKQKFPLRACYFIIVHYRVLHLPLKHLVMTTGRDKILDQTDH